MELLDALRLVYVVDEDASRDGDRLDAALGGGVSALWLRAPEVTGSRLYRLACDLRDRCRGHGAALIVGDRADVALAADVDGVQLGHRSPPALRVRPWFGRWIGVSCHGARELARASAAGADFAVLSPVFGVPEKGPPLGPAAFRALRSEVDLPVVALGGIDPETAPAVREAGANGIAVIRALLHAEDPAEQARRLLAPLTAR